MHDANVMARDNHESTPLHRAVQEGTVYLTRFLLKHGADVAAKDDGGMTPLHACSLITAQT